MNFGEYARKRQIVEIYMEMDRLGIDARQYDLKNLSEADLKKIMGSLALAAAPFISGAEHKAPPPDKPAMPYTYQYSPLMHDAQRDADIKADKDYVRAGGRRYEQSLEDAQEFTDFRKTAEHADILRRAGLPNSYVPSSVRSFVFGSHTSSAHSIDDVSVKLLERDVVKHFGRESSVHIVRSKDLKTGGTIITADITGHTLARDEQEASQRARMQVEQILKRHGFSTEGMREVTGTMPKVALDKGRHTIDYAESHLRSFPFAFRVELVREQGMGESAEATSVADSESKERKCLGCDKMFQSERPSHRICSKCERKKIRRKVKYQPPTALEKNQEYQRNALRLHYASKIKSK